MIRQLQTRRSSPLRFGLVTQQDIPTARVRVQLPDLDQVSSYWLQVINRGSQNDKDFWIPDIGEQVACLMDDQDESGVVLGSFFQSVDTPPAGMTADKRHFTFKDGTSFEYDRATHLLDLKFLDDAEIKYDGAAHVLSHTAQDGAIIKYDAGAHALSMVMPSGATLAIRAGATEILFDSFGNLFIEGQTLQITAATDITLGTSLGSTTLNTIIGAVNNIINLLKTAVQGGSGIGGTPPPLT